MLARGALCSVGQTKSRVRRHSQQYKQPFILCEDSERLPLRMQWSTLVPSSPKPEPGLQAGGCRSGRVLLQAPGSLGAWWQPTGINITCCFLALGQEKPVTGRPQGRIKTISTWVGFTFVSLHHLLFQLQRTPRWSSAFTAQAAPSPTGSLYSILNHTPYPAQTVQNPSICW